MLLGVIGFMMHLFMGKYANVSQHTLVFLVLFCLFFHVELLCVCVCAYIEVVTLKGTGGGCAFVFRALACINMF